MADLLVAIDGIINIYNPEVGFYNGIPYVISTMLSWLGVAALLICCTTQEFVNHIPIITKQMQQLQDMMRKAIQRIDPLSSHQDTSFTCGSESLKSNYNPIGNPVSPPTDTNV